MIRTIEGELKDAFLRLGIVYKSHETVSNSLRGNIYEYNNIGRLFMGLNNTKDAQYYFYKSAGLNKFLFDISSQNIFSKLEITKDTKLMAVNHLAMVCALNCGDEVFLRKFAESLSKVSEMDNQKDYNFNATLLQKALILGDKKNINFYSEIIFDCKYSRLTGFEQGNRFCLMGIVNQNNEQFHSGIIQLVKTFKRESKNWLANEICLEATAMARLGLKYDMNIEFSNGYISKELLTMNENKFEEDKDLNDILKNIKKFEDEQNKPIWKFW